MISYLTNERCSIMLRKYENNPEAGKEILDKVPLFVSNFLKKNQGNDWSGYEKYLSSLCFDDLTEYVFLIRENRAVSAAQQLLRNGGPR